MKHARLLKRILVALAAFMIIVMTAAGVAGFLAWRFVDGRGGVAQLITDAGNGIIGDKGRLEIETARIGFVFDRAPVRLMATGVVLDYGGATTSLPALEVAFTPAGLASGEFIPDRLIASGLELNVEAGNLGGAGRAEEIILNMVAAFSGFGDADNRFTVLSSAHLTNATIHVLDGDGRAVMTLAPFDFAFNAAGDGGRVAVSAALSGGGKIALDARIIANPDDSHHDITIAIRGGGITRARIDSLLALLPDGAEMPRGVRWANERVRGGVIDDFTIDVALQHDRNSDAGFDAISLKEINGTASMRDAGLLYLKGVPEAENIALEFEFSKTRLHAEVVLGSSAGIDASGSQFTLTFPGKNSGDRPQAALQLQGRGDLANALRLIQNDRFDFLKGTGINPAMPSGEVTADISIAWEIPLPGAKPEFDIDAGVALAGATLGGLPLGITMTHGDAVVRYADRGVHIKGTGLFDGAEAEVEFTRNAYGVTELAVTAPNNPAVTAAIDRRLNINLRGQAGMKLILKSINTAAGTPGDDFVIDVALNLDDAAIENSQLMLTKKAGTPADAVMKLHVREGKLRRVDNITINSDGFAFSGQADFDARGKITKAILGNVVWNNATLRNVAIDRTRNDVPRIRAETDVIDLTPLRGGYAKGGKEGFLMDFELTGERIIVDPDVALSGNATISLDGFGGGTGTFHGDLELRGRPFMTETALEIAFSGGHESLRGIGLMGGAEAAFSIAPSKRGGYTLRVDTEKGGGRVLHALGITDSIRNGKLAMSVDFDPADTGHYNALMEIHDFDVIEAPDVLRMLSLLSLTGLFGLIEGEGLRFSEGFAHIEVSPGRQEIHTARASGTRLALDVVGVIHTDDDTLDVSGVILPMRFINSVLGAVPVLGRIVTGADKSGFLATQFSMTGPVDDPDASVQGAASLAPGIFRDIISPDWVSRERERLIPDSPENDPAHATEHAPDNDPANAGNTGGG